MRRRVSAAAAPCWSTASRASRASPRRRASTAARSTTVDGLSPAVRDDLAAAFVATGGSQCGFCTPGILVRVSAAAEAKGKTRRVDLDRALAAHLCRCTGWQTVYEAIDERARPVRRRATRTAAAAPRRRARRWRRRRSSARRAAGRRRLRRRQRSPRRAGRGAVAARLDRTDRSRRPASTGWSPSRCSRRARSPARCRGDARPSIPTPPLPLPDADRRVACASRPAGSSPPTSSPTRRGARPAVSPRRRSPTAAPSAARPRRWRPPRRASSPTTPGASVRVVYSREDVVRLGPKRPPIAAVRVPRRPCRADARHGGR